MTDLQHGSLDPAPPGQSRPGGAGVVVLVVLALAGIAAGVVVGLGGGDRSPTAGPAGVGLEASPLELDLVADHLAAHYQAAADHPAVYTDVPCYCGCEEFLGHRDLYDCFVRADGAGWDSHAAGCGVCIGESATVRELLGEGRDVAAVRAAVIEQFGSTPTTAPPTG